VRVLFMIVEDSDKEDSEEEYEEAYEVLEPPLLFHLTQFPIFDA
jgi:hypothetical protein